jgi:shikimate dehydrogenase
MDSPDTDNSLDVFPVIGLLGQGIGYSLSPMLHDAAGQASGRECDFQLFDVHPEGLDGMLRRVVEFPELVGFNVTTPYKEEVAKRLDALHDSAREVGAVNTVAHRGEHLIGYNTDRPALVSVFRAAIAEGGLQSDGWTVVLLGAGGAARAVAWAALDAGMIRHLIVSTRSRDRMHSFKNDIYTAYSRAGVSFSSHGWLDWATLFVDKPAMLINATPLGSLNADGLIDEPSPVPPGERLGQFSVVLDLAYSPPETELMQAARDAGCTSIGGAGMLVEQAVLSRALWFGTGMEHIERVAMVAMYTSWAVKSKSLFK